VAFHPFRHLHHSRVGLVLLLLLAGCPEGTPHRAPVARNAAHHEPQAGQTPAGVASNAHADSTSVASTSSVDSGYAPTLQRLVFLNAKVMQLEDSGRVKEALDFLEAQSSVDDDARFLLARGLLTLRFTSDPRRHSRASRWVVTDAHALNLLAKAATNGHPFASAELGRIKLAGWGTSKDPFEARELLLAAANGGDDADLFFLSECVENGSVPGQAGEAVGWLRALSERNHLPAVLSLSDKLWRGEHATEDRRGAVRCLRQALSLPAQALSGRVGIALREYLTLRGDLREPGDEELISRALSSSLEERAPSVRPPGY
jgi:TPR repeat protein